MNIFEHATKQIVDGEEPIKESTSVQPAKKSQKRKQKNANKLPGKRKKIDLSSQEKQKVDNFPVIKQKIDIKSIVWAPSNQNVSCLIS